MSVKTYDQMKQDIKDKYIRAFINMVKFLRSFILVYAVFLIKYGKYEVYPILEIVMGLIIAYLGIEAIVIFYGSIYEEDVKVLKYQMQIDKEIIKKLEKELEVLKRR